MKLKNCFLLFAKADYARVVRTLPDGLGRPVPRGRSVENVLADFCRLTESGEKVLQNGIAEN